MRAVRIVTLCSRTRCTATRSCFSMRFIGTAGISSDRTALKIASVSARSVLLQRMHEDRDRVDRDVVSCAP